MFSNTENRTESSAIIFSIIQTAIANGIDYKKYIEKVINNIQPNSTKEELENLLPWTIELNYIWISLTLTLDFIWFKKCW